MAKILLIVITVFSFAAQAQAWRPFGYESFSDNEKKVIQQLSPLTNSNKPLVQMLFSEADFSNCAIKAEMKWNSVVVSLAHLESRTAFGFSIDVNQALISERYFPSKDSVTYIIVSEQNVGNDDIISMTYFMYFSVQYDGSISELKVFTKKNRLKSSLLPFMRSKASAEPAHAILCR